MNSEGAAKVFMSNQLDVLADKLFEQLFQEGSSPFERRLVVIEYPLLKRYLTFRFARKAVAAGIKIVSLTQALEEINPHFTAKKKQVPSALELSIDLQCKIREVLGSDDPLFAPLIEYIGSDEKKILSLASELGSLFLRYGMYAGPQLTEWKTQNGWKQALYARVFAAWAEVEEKLDPLLLVEGQIHFFAFGYLPPIYLDFFKDKQSFFYHLSPCSLFWGDLFSDKEKSLLHKRLKSEKDKERLDFYFRDTNSLLANLGKLGRLSLNLMEDLNLELEEDYILNKRQTLLEHIQSDLLDLRNPHEGPKIFVQEEDKSIQFHTASSKLREVEILLVNILASQEQFQETLVLAPDISEYAPFIHMVFGEAKIHYSIFDENAFSQSPFIKGYRHLLSLARGRFEVDAVLKLFSNVAFLAKFNLGINDLQTFQAWIKEAKIRWGKDAAQKQQILEEKEVSSIGTWEFGLNRLLVALAKGEEDLSIDLSEAEKLGELITLTRALFEHLNPLQNGEMRSLDSWVGYLTELAQRYFVIDEMGEVFLSKLQALASSLIHLEKNLFSYHAMERILENLFSNAKTPYQASNACALKFCSLNIAGPLKAKATYLLGMQEGAFPRIETPSSLSEIPFVETSADRDRYLFLQLLISASHTFTMSFVKGENENPSCVVQELLSYINQGYVCVGEEPLSRKLTVEHPVLSYDKNYFKTPSFHLQKEYLAAKSRYAKREKTASVLFPEFYASLEKTEKAKKNDIVIELKKLSKFAKHPIQFYFNHVLKIYLESEEHFEKGEFILSHIDRAVLRKDSLKKGFSHLFEKAHHKGMLPLGIFKEVARCNAADHKEEYHAHLEALNVDPKTLITIELKASCAEPDFKNSHHLILPPLSVPLEEGRKACIVGKLENVGPCGLLVNETHYLKDLLKVYPSFLVYLNLPLEKLGFPPRLLLSKKGKVKEKLEGDPLDLLAAYIGYYERCLDSPSPLMPEWASGLLEEGVEELEKAIEISKNGFGATFEDLYLKQLFLKDPLFSSAHLHQTWSSYLREVFAPLLIKEEVK